MEPTRRTFVKRTLAATGGLALCPLACPWTPGRGTSLAAGEAALTRPGRVASGDFEPAYLRLEESSELKRREEELWRIFSDCHCCPRWCGANRLKGETGICDSASRLKVYSAGLHFGEERPLVGSGGSGTVFFSHCNLLCCFCQNWEINHRGDGRYLSHRGLAEMMLDLQQRGCHNINLVTPTHVVPNIVKALRIAIHLGLHLPLVYNTGGYDSIEVIHLLAGIVDVYLPDFKYQDGELAAKYSFEADDYPETAARAIREMYRQVGDLEVDERGTARRGLILRHLVLPHNIAGTDRFVRWVAAELSPSTYVNIMARYRPEHRAAEYPELARRLTRDEWRQALAWAHEAGLDNLAA